MQRAPTGQPTTADHTLIKCTIVRVNKTKDTNLPHALTYVNLALDASLTHALQESSDDVPSCEDIFNFSGVN